ncbi:MAG: hypothetical protein IPJ65_13750 [Archangiaceae bacterium]|nr:hypothetical protein [Archangiaceae bacterium]
MMPLNLGIGSLETDWSAYNSFRNHSSLFLRDDLRPDAALGQPVFARRLGAMVRRLEMLGYTLDGCERQYKETIAQLPRYYASPRFSFHDFAKVITHVDAAKVERLEEQDFDLGEFARDLLADPEFTKTQPAFADLDRDDDGTFFEWLPSPLILRLLAEHPANLELEVVWRLDGARNIGLTTENEAFEPTSESERCLIVTEGTSDGDILKTSLPRVAPDVQDFFHFVDMKDNYPFTGTGNVVRFCQGLAKIHIQNRILVVLDNDTTGREALEDLKKIVLPPRMRVTTLPDHPKCSSVRTLGPSGVSIENVNGTAVAIECFLDIWDDTAPPEVRWSSYSKKLKTNQGALIGKEEYVARFHERIKRAQPYNLDGLDALWKFLIAKCPA